MTHYFLFSISILDSSTTGINTSYPTNRPSICITEYFDFSPDVYDVQSMSFSDTYDKMDDDADDNIN